MSPDLARAWETKLDAWASENKLPRELVEAVRRGVQAAFGSGIMYGYPVIDVGVTLTGAAYNPSTSTAMAYEAAAALGFDAACRKALSVDLIDVRRLERILIEALETESEPTDKAKMLLPGRFARPGSSFAYHDGPWACGGLVPTIG